MNYWVKQDHASPAFPELEWSRPENRRHAGKLLIVGGNLHGFSAPATAFVEAEKAGIGTIRVVLPDSIKKTVGSFMPEADFCPSTPSGSFASASLDTLLEHSAWADGVLIAGDLGKNSETAIVLEKFVLNYHGLLTLGKDTLDYFIDNPAQLLQRPDTLLIMNFAQLQKFAVNAKSTDPITSTMDLLYLVEAMHGFTLQYPISIITKHHDTILVAVQGRVSTIKIDSTVSWSVKAAAGASTWWLQQPTKPFEALTTSVTK